MHLKPDPSPRYLCATVSTQDGKAGVAVKAEKGPFQNVGLEKLEIQLYILAEGWKSWENIFVIEELLAVGLFSQLFQMVSLRTFDFSR